MQWDHDGTKRTEGEVLHLLESLVRCEKPEVVVETGTFAGHGSVALSNGLVANGYGHLYTVENDPKLYEQLERESLSRTSFIRDDSLEFVKGLVSGSVGFMFIDCGPPEHRVKVAREAFDIVEGLILVHDTRTEPLIYGSLGRPHLHIPTLHGVGIWRNDVG